jgi:CubicO group peptidase (beta-lactamase class C family)
MNKIKLIIIVYLTLLLKQSEAQTIKDSDCVFPDSTWQYIEKPDTMGWNIAKLIDLEQFVLNKTNLTGLMVIYKGKVLYDFGDVKELSYIASCRKSVLCMLYGRYVDKGIINLNKTIGELEIDELVDLLEIEKKAKVENLLTARSGVYLPSAASGSNENLPNRGSKQPGSYYLYNNWDFNVAGFVFEKESGKNIYDALEEQIASPIKMEDWERKEQKKEFDPSSKYPAYHMYLSTRDMARIGYLMLRNGEWNGKQLIPISWIKKSTSLVTSVDEIKISDPSIKNKPWWKWGYGYLWRVWDDNANIRPELRGAFSATGAWGQYITIIPSLDIVIAAKTRSEYRRSTNYETYMNLLDILIDAKMDYFAVTESLKSNSVKSFGTVVDVRNNYDHTEYFKYKYDYNGQEYYGWSCSRQKIFCGNKFIVSLNPDNPEINRIDLKNKIDK